MEMLKVLGPGAKQVRAGIRSVPGTRRLWGAIRNARLSVLRSLYGSQYHEVVFTKVFRENVWGDPESRSGTGSSLSQTAFVREGLAELVKEFAVCRLLDIPCGDFHWMKEVEFPLRMAYTGGDIVDEIVTRNTARYGNGRAVFQKMDILRDPLPEVDMVLCRDCFIHFGFDDISTAIRNLKRSGSVYLLTTHYTGDRDNVDIRTGQLGRPLNLTRSPFGFPPPLRLVDERCTEGEGRFRDKALALWRLGDLSA